MGLRLKIKREPRLSSFAPPPPKGEAVLNIRPVEAPEKKKTKAQLAKEALDEHMRQWQIQFDKDQEERTKRLGELPF